mmetsp:Transcript_20715/g.38851  ORF Transcript_20715/g.38851 Transcript_20715/m.38851 type:complete len:124 (-) Transcript_20715:194-565(-)|eukprot:CAMPEP_0197435702 /NCGR_PEP_ID=MMETSP1175-20131217/3260_1 /TAXON_ID=1003142 /ORGANISM="Triceratium dubium, Strain CCMP147" /LENGTH=123 /DNA_ID=CAMNT_0042964807 /DNA_START=291 /DNA_END=662 /DNA_ORIENTATION=-
MKNVTCIVAIILACAVALASGHEVLFEAFTSDEGRRLGGGGHMKRYTQQDWKDLYDRCCIPAKGIDESCGCPIKNGDEKWKKLLPPRVYARQQKKWAKSCKTTIWKKANGYSWKQEEEKSGYD